MKRYKRIATAGLSVLVVVVGLRLLATRLPVTLEGSEWRSIEKCAENQKHRYQDNHPTTFMGWFRGLEPRVQTMGDGTIQLFKDGKLMTMVGSKKRKSGI